MHKVTAALLTQIRAGSSSASNRPEPASRRYVGATPQLERLDVHHVSLGDPRAGNGLFAHAGENAALMVVLGSAGHRAGSSNANGRGRPLTDRGCQPSMQAKWR